MPDQLVNVHVSRQWLSILEGADGDSRDTKGAEELLLVPRDKGRRDCVGVPDMILVEIWDEMSEKGEENPLLSVE